jgi:hypothetical protein
VTDLDKIRQAEQSLRDTIIEAHQAIQDLKAACKAAAEERAQARKLVDGLTDMVSEAMSDQIKEGLENYDKALYAAIGNGERAVLRRFDQLASALLGEKKPTQESLVAHVQRWRKENGL